MEISEQFGINMLRFAMYVTVSKNNLTPSGVRGGGPLDPSTGRRETRSRRGTFGGQRLKTQDHRSRSMSAHVGWGIDDTNMHGYGYSLCCPQAVRRVGDPTVFLPTVYTGTYLPASTMYVQLDVDGLERKHNTRTGTRYTHRYQLLAAVNR